MLELGVVGEHRHHPHLDLREVGGEQDVPLAGDERVADRCVAARELLESRVGDRHAAGACGHGVDVGVDDAVDVLVEEVAEVAVRELPVLALEQHLLGELLDRYRIAVVGVGEDLELPLVDRWCAGLGEDGDLAAELHELVRQALVRPDLDGEHVARPLLDPALVVRAAVVHLGAVVRVDQGPALLHPRGDAQRRHLQVVRLGVGPARSDGREVHLVQTGGQDGVQRPVGPVRLEVHRDGVPGPAVLDERLVQELLAQRGAPVDEPVGLRLQPGREERVDEPRRQHGVPDARPGGLPGGELLHPLDVEAHVVADDVALVLAEGLGDQAGPHVPGDRPAGHRVADLREPDPRAPVVRGQARGLQVEREGSDTALAEPALEVGDHVGVLDQVDLDP